MITEWRKLGIVVHGIDFVPSIVEIGLHRPLTSKKESLSVLKDPLVREVRNWLEPSLPAVQSLCLGNCTSRESGFAPSCASRRVDG